MKFGCSLIFAVAFLFSAVAFPQHGNLSDDETLVMHGYNKSVKSLSLLSDDPSPGQQDGMDVAFVGNGPINLTLDYDLIFKIPDLTKCTEKGFGICFDSFYAPDENSRHFCSPSQCYLKLHLAENGYPMSENSNWGKTWDDVEKSDLFSWKPSTSACKPKTENGMIQMQVLDPSCPVKAKSAQIKYPEAPASTVQSPRNSDQSSASASLWYQSWWFILIIVFICVALILGVAAGVLFYFRKKRNTTKTPPKPPPFADAPTIETLFQESERREQLKAAAAAQKKKMEDKKKKKPEFKKKKRERPFPGGDDTISYLEDYWRRHNMSNKSI